MPISQQNICHEQRYSEKVKAAEKVPEPATPKPMEEDDDDDDEKDDGNKISRKKLRKMNRLTVAELKQVFHKYVLTSKLLFFILFLFNYYILFLLQGSILIFKGGLRAHISPMIQFRTYR